MSEPFLFLDPACCDLPEPLANDIRLLDRLLGEMLTQQEGPELARLARRLCHDDAEEAYSLISRMPELQDPLVVQRLLRAFTALFQLLNAAQQKEIVRVNRQRRTQLSGAPRPESIAEAVLALKNANVSADGVRRLLSRLDICPTLTAHPTEARRRAVLDKLQTISECLMEGAETTRSFRLDRPLDTEGLAEGALRRALLELWRTDELRSTAMTVDDEVRNALYYFDHGIMDVVAWLHDDLRSALSACYPGEAFEIPAFLTFRSWVGGDRDGNPHVTADVTWRTLLAHKRLALRAWRRRAEALQRELTQSARQAGVAPELIASIEEDRRSIALPEDVERHHENEPYALKLAFVRARLEATERSLDGLGDWRAEGPSFAPRPPAYENAGQLLADLRLIQSSLRNNNGAALADEGPLAHFVTQVQAFGFRLASLDVRQHSEAQERFLDEAFLAAGALPEDRPYSSLPEPDKVRLLTRELMGVRPLLPRGWLPSEAARDLPQLFEVIGHAQRYISPESVTSYIISMTHGLSDILEPLVIAKEAGLVRWRASANGLAMESDLDIVPLFETIDDLNGCDALMTTLFANRAYRAHLAARGGFQEVMLGYSDSSKDGGFLAANFALHDTQARLAAVCRRAGVELRLFHGRGGTVGRGGGRANRAILSQPPGSCTGRIRFTEQGEVVSYRYSLPPFAHRHLEQIASAVLLSAGLHSGSRPARNAWIGAMREMAAQSRRAYRALVYDDPEFWDFYVQATPIGHISQLAIGSRPARRPDGKGGGIENLRAIPWVFAWVQSRYVAPGWYGLGSALLWYIDQAPGNLEALREMYRKWPLFHTVLDDAQLELMRAHMPTAALYAARVRPAELGRRIHAEIEAEYARTRETVLSVTGAGELLSHASMVRRMIGLRNPAVLPLSRLQVALMESGGTLSLLSETDDPAWRDALLLSITAIAAAMQSTG
ncbi:MAG TPA: phosphoenolpyruvate carboxylase [Armatimonadota bacterium]